MKQHKMYTLLGIVLVGMACGLTACSSDENTVDDHGRLEGRFQVNVAQGVGGTLTRGSDATTSNDTVRLYPEEGDGPVLLVIKEREAQPLTRAENGETTSSFIYKNWVENGGGTLIGNVTGGSKTTPDEETATTRTYKYTYAAPGDNKSVVTGLYQQANADITPTVTWQEDAGKPTGVTVNVTAPDSYCWPREGTPADNERTAWQFLQRVYQGTGVTDKPLQTAQNGIKELVCAFTFSGTDVEIKSVSVSDCNKTYEAKFSADAVTEVFSSEAGTATYNNNPSNTENTGNTEFNCFMRFIRAKLNIGTLSIKAKNSYRTVIATYNLEKLGKSFDNVSRLKLKMGID